ncbi:unnamed protein product [Pleuronectes platessa]|uniref:Uncharacterized protein n=1 Tax=Pleuronectes platessa TaxID=8262 RepID=A0A9N7YTL3_PLEPL|nr:unnamed protein product [Pleuronectes platessa]
MVGIIPPAPSASVRSAQKQEAPLKEISNVRGSSGSFPEVSVRTAALLQLEPPRVIRKFTECKRGESRCSQTCRTVRNLLLRLGGDDDPPSSSSRAAHTDRDAAEFKEKHTHTHRHTHWRGHW